MKKFPPNKGPWKLGGGAGWRAKVVDADNKLVATMQDRKDAWNGDLVASAPEAVAIVKRLAGLTWPTDPTEFDTFGQKMVQAQLDAAAFMLRFGDAEGFEV